MAKVIVRVNPKTSEVTYEVNGVEGKSCEDVTAAVVRANEEVAKQYTSEYDDTQSLPDYIVNPGDDS